MKIKHRIPSEAHFVSDAITPRYQAEVDAALARAAQRERVALQRLDAAERKLAKVAHLHGARSRVRAVLVARELVELRRQELLAIQRQMSRVPASAAHRSTGERHRPVPNITTL